MRVESDNTGPSTKDIILMDTQTVHSMGQTITKDAQTESAHLKQQWQTLEDSWSPLPACLRDDSFHRFEWFYQTNFSEILQNRQDLGEALSHASDLMKLQDQIQGKTFDIFATSLG